MLKLYLESCVLSAISIIIAAVVCSILLKSMGRKLNKSNVKKSKIIFAFIIVSMVPILREIIIFTMFHIVLCSDECFLENYGKIERDI